MKLFLPSFGARSRPAAERDLEQLSDLEWICLLAEKNINQTNALIQNGGVFLSDGKQLNERPNSVEQLGLGRARRLTMALGRLPCPGK